MKANTGTHCLEHSHDSVIIYHKEHNQVHDILQVIDVRTTKRATHALLASHIRPLTGRSSIDICGGRSKGACLRRSGSRSHVVAGGVNNTGGVVRS
jgi:hypothetical protein